jgi:hypothetical protein
MWVASVMGSLYVILSGCKRSRWLILRVRVAGVRVAGVRVAGVDGARVKVGCGLRVAGGFALVKGGPVGLSTAERMAVTRALAARCRRERSCASWAAGTATTPGARFAGRRWYPAGARWSMASALVYGKDVMVALHMVWAVLHFSCGQRPAAVMAELVDSLERHGELVLDEPTRLRCCRSRRPRSTVAWLRNGAGGYTQTPTVTDVATGLDRAQSPEEQGSPVAHGRHRRHPPPPLHATHQALNHGPTTPNRRATTTPAHQTQNQNGMKRGEIPKTPTQTS